MRLLLDTHAFLWFVMDDDRLGSDARSHIEDGGNEALLSAVSIWEIAIKTSVGKLTLGEPLKPLLDREISRNKFQILTIRSQPSKGHPIRLR